MYYKNGKPYSGPKMSKAWYEANGYTAEAPEIVIDDTHEWVNKEAFIAAVYTLVTPEMLTGLMQDPALLREAVAGMMLFTTDAAPGNLVDLKDGRITDFLNLTGLTLEQVKSAMEAMEG